MDAGRTRWLSAEPGPGSLKHRQLSAGADTARPVAADNEETLIKESTHVYTHRKGAEE